MSNEDKREVSHHPRWVKAIDLGCSGQTQPASQAKRLGESKLVGRGKDVNNSAAGRDILRLRGNFINIILLRQGTLNQFDSTLVF